MIKTWVLIMLINTGYGGHTLTTEFNSLETCQTAAKSLVEQKSWTRTNGEVVTDVKAWGCYQK